MDPLLQLLRGHTRIQHHGISIGSIRPGGGVNKDLISLAGYSPALLPFCTVYRQKRRNVAAAEKLLKKFGGT